MISSVLVSLEKLQADLAAIDPSREMAAVDAVADLACALRDRLAALGDERRRMPPKPAMTARLATDRGCPSVPIVTAVA